MEKDLSQGKKPSVKTVLIQPPGAGAANNQSAYSTSYHFIKFLTDNKKNGGLGLKQSEVLDLLTNYYTTFYESRPATEDVWFNEKDWDQAIKKTFGNQGIKNIDDLQQSFENYLDKQFPQ